ncbi:PAS domain-containing protein [Flavobacterium sp. W1B]|uniref:PAS domain-containing protein n=1 Tax=Flavobacterium sp. W1B TaxID=3394146 RepID=UPI0039BD73D2
MEQNFIRPEPIDREVVWDKKKIVLSRTDKFGTIEYANDVFIDVSGYEDYELIAQPHNIVRHPDMPKVIFKILWDSLKSGNNFHAVVKNLAKSGRYYWMITDFEIIKEKNGEIKNYIGKRKAVPNDALKNHIEPLYQRLLQIEKVSGLDASEKYLAGFLEEKKMSYEMYIKDVVIGKGFFKKLFN